MAEGVFMPTSIGGDNTGFGGAFGGKPQKKLI